MTGFVSQQADALVDHSGVEAAPALALRVRALPVVCFLTCCLTFLYLQLFLLPHTPFYLFGDGLIFVNNAARMLNGEMIYREFFQITTPGSEVIYRTLFKLFGARIWVHNAVVLGLGLGLVSLNVLIARKVIRGWAAFLPALFFLAFQFRFELTGAHHWFSMLLVMAALVVIIERRSRWRLACAGALCGLAACFTQHRGVVAIGGLAAFVLWEYRQKQLSWRAALRAEALLVAGFLVASLAGLAYFVWEVGFARFIECTVVFPAKYYSSGYWMNNWGVYLRDLPVRTGDNLIRGVMYAFTYALVPLVYLIFWIQYRRRVKTQPQERWDQLMLLNIMGLALFIGVASAPAWYRLIHISQPGLILLGWMLDRPHRLRRALIRATALLLSAILLRALWTQQNNWHGYLDSPAGRVAFHGPETFESHQWVVQHTHPSEPFFAATPAFYALAGLRNPSAVPFLLPNSYTRPEQVRNVIEGLEKSQARFVYWTTYLDRAPDQPLRDGDNLEPLRDYLRGHYHVTKIFSARDYMLERNREPVP
ncbi:MAG TPA: hypothetical protein VFD58_17785 [Blastocatellia bacterium]|nr:hypothetical protein [Blastocatellia bacterium]